MPAVTRERAHGNGIGRLAILARHREICGETGRVAIVPAFARAHGLREAAARIRACEFDGVAFDPDLVGFSVFLWSFPFFLRVAALLKQDDPERVVVFGGPSARPVMLEARKVGHAWVAYGWDLSAH